MVAIVYALSVVTSLLCAWMLLRSYSGTRTRLLMWAGLCFLGLAADNALFLVDTYLVPEISLTVWRGLPALGGLGALLYGLVWEAR
jgi:hypothetical protein